ncbi:MAG: type II toxin-antitoxin system RelE/ParE family toxin [Sphingomonadaceae bacterium]
MPLEIITLRAARNDLAEILAFSIETWGSAVAEAYVRGLGQAIALLADYPDLGTRVTGIRPPMRVHVHRKHRIFYRHDTQAVTIVRVFHIARDSLAVLI